MFTSAASSHEQGMSLSKTLHDRAGETSVGTRSVLVQIAMSSLFSRLSETMILFSLSVEVSIEWVRYRAKERRSGTRKHNSGNALPRRLSDGWRNVSPAFTVMVTISTPAARSIVSEESLPAAWHAMISEPGNGRRSDDSNSGTIRTLVRRSFSKLCASVRRSTRSVHLPMWTQFVPSVSLDTIWRQGNGRVFPARTSKWMGSMAFCRVQQSPLAIRSSSVVNSTRSEICERMHFCL